MTILMNELDVESYLGEVFPEIYEQWPSFKIKSFSELKGVFTLAYDKSMLRPGGTISGPTMMTFTDLAIYATILAHIGPESLAVTTNLNFDFINKPPQDDLICKCYILKLGKRLVTARAEISTKSKNKVCTHAIGTYSIPPKLAI